MLKKLFTFLIFSMFLVIGISKAQEPPPPVLGAFEHYTNLWSVSYDYQTNGSVRYLLQDPTNPLKFCNVLMSQQDSNTAAGTARYIYYSYSEDGGVSWTSDVITTVASHGFPCLTLSNGIPVFTAHQSGTAGTRVWKDVIFGGYSLSELIGIQPISGANQPIWPHISGTTNGNLVLVAAPNDGTGGTFYGHVATYTSSWSAYSQKNLIGGPSGNFDAASGPDGTVAVVGTNYFNQVANSPGFAPLNWYRSADNGVTFDGGATITSGIIEGSDTMYAALTGGYQTVYSGTTPHIVFAAYNLNWEATAGLPGANENAYKKSRIYHWSPSTGFTVIASSSNIPNLTDTLNQVNMAPLTQPTITVTASGKLICAYTAFLRGNVQTVIDGNVLNCGEIFYSYSGDNGTTWSVPSNVTNTPFIEEKHPSLPTVTNVDALRLTYVRDLMAGAWSVVPAWGKAPVYSIFYAGPTLGIKENLSIAKEYTLYQNFPNPFNPTTTISYYIQKSGLVSLKVYDMLGKEVASLVNEIQTQGPKEIAFNASSLSSGIYYYTITTGDFKDTKKMMLIK